MGCDIHVHTEKRVIKSDGTEVWINTDCFKCNEWKIVYKIDNNSTYGDSDEDDLLIDYPYKGRDYKLFGILAGVRTDPENIIAEPRGLPDDVSDVTKNQYNEDWCHTPSWLTLKELFKYKQKFDQKRTIWIKESDWNKYDNDELDTNNVYFSNPHLPGYIKKKWSPLYRGFKVFLKDIKRKANADLNPWGFINKKVLWKDYSDNYRIVFWFDS